MKSQLTHTQASPPGSGTDRSRGSRNGGESLDTRRNGPGQPQPQTLSGFRTRKRYGSCFKIHMSRFLKSNEYKLIQEYETAAL